MSKHTVGIYNKKYHLTASITKPDGERLKVDMTGGILACKYMLEVLYESFLKK